MHLTIYLRFGLQFLSIKQVTVSFIVYRTPLDKESSEKNIELKKNLDFLFCYGLGPSFVLPSAILFKFRLLVENT